MKTHSGWVIDSDRFDLKGCGRVVKAVVAAESKELTHTDKTGNRANGDGGWNEATPFPFSQVAKKSETSRKMAAASFIYR